MPTVHTIETARACVYEGAIAMAEYVNQHGQIAFAVCMVESDIAGVENSPYVDPDTIIWHYRDGAWLIKPPDEK